MSTWTRRCKGIQPLPSLQLEPAYPNLQPAPDIAPPLGTRSNTPTGFDPTIMTISKMVSSFPNIGWKPPNGVSNEVLKKDAFSPDLEGMAILYTPHGFDHVQQKMRSILPIKGGQHSNAFWTGTKWNEDHLIGSLGFRHVNETTLIGVVDGENVVIKVAWIVGDSEPTDAITSLHTRLMRGHTSDLPTGFYNSSKRGGKASSGKLITFGAARRFGQDADAFNMPKGREFLAIYKGKGDKSDPCLLRAAAECAKQVTHLERRFLPQLDSIRASLADMADPEGHHRMHPDVNAFQGAMSDGYVSGPHVDGSKSGKVEGGNETIVFAQKGPLPDGHKPMFAAAGCVFHVPPTGFALMSLSPDVEHGTLPTSSTEPSCDHDTAVSVIFTKDVTVRAGMSQVANNNPTTEKWRASTHFLPAVEDKHADSPLAQSRLWERTCPGLYARPHPPSAREDACAERPPYDVDEPFVDDYSGFDVMDEPDPLIDTLANAARSSRIEASKNDRLSQFIALRVSQKKSRARAINVWHGKYRSGYTERVAAAWVDANFKPFFIERVAGHFGRWCYVPIGREKHSNSCELAAIQIATNLDGRLEFGAQDPFTTPEVCFQSAEGEDFCLPYSAASAAHHLGDVKLSNVLKEKASKIEQMEKQMEEVRSTAVEIGWQATRIASKEEVAAFDPEKACPDGSVLVMHLKEDDGAADHAWSVALGFIFDANRSQAVRLSKESLAAMGYAGIVSASLLTPKKKIADALEKKRLKRKREGEISGDGLC